MARTPCKGIKKDGTPCQGHGLPQYDGLCIAHGPTPDQTHQWRSLGGQNSSTAARLDKRIPERLKGAIDQIDDGIVQVAQGTMEPAALTAMCRGAKALVDLYRLADQDMETIRSEETEQAAAGITGVRANLELLETIDAVSARQDQYRSQSLVDQRLAELVPSPDPDQPPQIVLTEEGRRRFGYRRACTITQQEIDDWYDVLDETRTISFSIDERHEMVQELVAIHSNVLDAREDLTLEPSPPTDPLTGQPMIEPPACVKASLTTKYDAPSAAPTAEFLENRLNQVSDLLFKAMGKDRAAMVRLNELDDPDDNPSPQGEAPGSDLATAATVSTSAETPHSEPSPP
ncbi:MAG: hypothetical protein F4X62_05755 [Caldilineaceae bacterium SB0662_bin_25]|nr:hypothetical protein [Caldilineaceae bacterium SB0662_bin_25]